MKNSKKNLTLGLVAGALMVGAQASAVNFTVDPSANWLGYMNWFELPQNGGAYAGGSPWGVADLKASFSGPVLTLSTNNIGDPNGYWYQGGGGPGAQGNKMMEANMYVEPVDTLLRGQTINFSGQVLGNSLLSNVDSLGNGWTSVAFIKDFAPDFSSFVGTFVPLTGSSFNISLPINNDSNRVLQYGFTTLGSCVWSTDAGNFGNIQLTAVPEPTSFLALGAGLLLIAKRRRSA